MRTPGLATLYTTVPAEDTQKCVRNNCPPRLSCKWSMQLQRWKLERESA